MGLALLIILTCWVTPAAAEPFWITDAETDQPLAEQLTEDTPPWEEAEATAADPSALQVNAASAILMECGSGQTLFEQNAHQPLPIASVTKVMTLLLVMEAIDDGRLRYDDMVTCSARAASMGGSQIWLKENERMSVEDLLNAAAIVSANDACAALAEHLSGTIEAFVAAMNERAAALGATETCFVDCSGLSDDGRSSAYDIALMSRELIGKHPDIQRFTTVWMDSLRDGQSELVNTNKLIRFYSGATGLKTGTTSAAHCCLAATAEREGLSLIAVVLGSPTTNDRFGGARSLLDFGFANYAVVMPSVDEADLLPVRVLHGTKETVTPVPPTPEGVLVEKAQSGRVETRVEMAPDVEAPVEAGQVIGEAVVTADGATLARIPLIAAAAVERLDFWRALWRMWGAVTAGQIA
ncbi:MAG: D-alanyl-D-alanine carboxypeptidase [Clostridia bacterium]|nr:D-alanyl-D-alanine carboxypeptidase [Clostridia bacterium]